MEATAKKLATMGFELSGNGFEQVSLQYLHTYHVLDRNIEGDNHAAHGEQGDALVRSVELTNSFSVQNQKESGTEVHRLRRSLRITFDRGFHPTFQNVSLNPVAPYTATEIERKKAGSWVGTDSGPVELLVAVYIYMFKFDGKLKAGSTVGMLGETVYIVDTP